MTSGRVGRATPRTWARVALAGLALLAAGLLQVLVGSRGRLLQLVVGTVLSVAVLAATAWWAFTTRRVWKRWLNLVIATLAALNIVVGFLEFGVRQAAGALAIAAGALIYATAARRALRPAGSAAADPGTRGLWTTGSLDLGVGLRSPTGGQRRLRQMGRRLGGLDLGRRGLGRGPDTDGSGSGTAGGPGGSGEPEGPGSGEPGGPGGGAVPGGRVAAGGVPGRPGSRGGGGCW